MKISEDGKRIEYQTYKEYLEHQALRRNTLTSDNLPIFDPHDHPWIVEDLKIFYKFIQRRARILDIGSRSGWSCLRMIYDGYGNVMGIDVQADNIAFAQNWGAPVEQADAHALPYDENSFDAVFTRHALEHMFDPQLVIQEATRVLKPGGIFFAVVPCEDKITDFEFAHSYIYDTPQRLTRLTTMLQNVYLWNSNDELTYIGIKPGLYHRWSRARLQGIMLMIRQHLFYNARLLKKSLLKLKSYRQVNIHNRSLAK